MTDAWPPQLSAALRILLTLALLGLGAFFGRTLLPGRTPLIERVARIGKPGLSPVLCRYTRLLTSLWCGYFVVAALLPWFAGAGFREAGASVAVASLLLFVGENWLRRFWLFRHECFPGVVQQVRDTVRVWRPRGNV